MGSRHILQLLAICAFRAIRVDPDTLPSIEVLLMPPKYPFPQIREYLNVLHDKREVAEKRSEESILKSYSRQLEQLQKQIPQIIQPVLKPLIKQWREGMYYPVIDSFIETGASNNIENLVVHVKPVPMPGNRVKQLITAIDQQRASEEMRQVSQGTTEFGQFSQIITQALRKSMTKYFKPNRNIHPINLPKDSSFLQHTDKNVSMQREGQKDGFRDLSFLQHTDKNVSMQREDQKDGFRDSSFLQHTGSAKNVSMQREDQKDGFRDSSFLQHTGSANNVPMQREDQKDGFRDSSFLQQIQRTDQNALNPVVNIRVGSSNIGDGLLDGDSYPSVLGMVAEENEMRTSAETTLFNEILYYSNQLVLEGTNMIKVLLFPPSTRMVAPGMATQTDPLETSFLQIPGVSQAMGKAASVVPIPPAAARVIRKRAMNNSTVQLDITPPQMDDWSTIDALNALLQAEKTLGTFRVKAYLKVKRELAKSIKAQIDRLVKSAAITWGIFPDPQNFDSIMNDG